MSGLIFSSGDSKVAEIRGRLKSVMQKGCGIIKNEESLLSCLAQLKVLKDCYDKDLCLSDRGLMWNENLLEALELENLLLSSFAVVRGALMREESRGSHFREDFPAKNDELFRRHTIASMNEDGDVTIGYSMVDCSGEDFSG